MARKKKFKVYRTPIGFHDAYVAAPSQKAALKAWGADVDLFARAVAETVDDEDLTRAPLEKPGTVIRVSRGSSAEHMAALPKDKPAPRRPAAPVEDDGPSPRRRSRSDTKHPARHAAKEEAENSPKPPSRNPASRGKEPSKPRPSRDRLEKAEKALEQAETDHKEAIASIREQEKALQQKRHELETCHKDEVKKLEAAITKARDSYRAALEKWRA